MARIVNGKNDKEKKLAEKKANAQKRSKAIFVLDNVKEQMLVEFSKNIPSEITKREQEFMKQLEKFEMAHTNEKGIVVAGEQFDTADFVDNAFKPIIRVAGMSPKYSADNVYMALDYFKQCVKKINKYLHYTPSIITLNTELKSASSKVISPDLKSPSSKHNLSFICLRRLTEKLRACSLAFFTCHSSIPSDTASSLLSQTDIAE